MSQFVRYHTLSNFNTFIEDIKCYHDVSSRRICILAERVRDIETRTRKKEPSYRIDSSQNVIDSKLLHIIPIKALAFPYRRSAVDDCSKITDNKSCHDDICFQCCLKSKRIEPGKEWALS